MTFIRCRRLAIAFYLLSLAATLAYVIPHAGIRLVIPWTAVFRHGAWVIVQAEPSSGLRAGDRILAANGDTRFRSIDPWRFARFVKPGDAYTFTVEREGTVIDQRLVARAAPVAVSPFLFTYLLQSLSFFGLGLLLGLRRPDLPVARLGWWAGFVNACMMLGNVVYPLAKHGWPQPAYLRPLMLFPALPALAGYRFLAAFPEPVPETRMWTILRRALTVLGIVSCITAPVTLAFDISGEWGVRIAYLFRNPYLVYRMYWMYDHGIDIFAVAAVLCIVAVLIRNYRLARQQRRKLRLMMAGVGLVLLAYAAAIALQVTPAARDVLLCFVPFPIAYAVLKNRVVDVGVVVRRGVQYLLARRSLEAVMVVPAALMLVRVIQRPQIWILLAPAPWAVALSLCAGALLLSRRPILAWLDRRFFRSAWDQERILSGLQETISRQVSFMATLDAVRGRLAEALHPETVHLFYREKRNAPLADGALVIPEDWPALPPGVSNHAPIAPHSMGDSPAIPCLANAEALVPFFDARGRAGGLIALGPKRSEEPYSAVDRGLLAAIAVQLGVAHENHLLANERVDAVLEDRNRIARELHDSLAQGFVGISIHLESAARRLHDDPDQAAQHLSQARSLARSSLGEVRRSVFGLRDAARSPVLAELIADLTRCLSTNSGIRVEVESAGDRALPDAVTFSLFRIAQESITNALKHSNATRIALRLDCTGSEARLTVCDNGCGFDTSRAPSSGHYGIIGMQERAAQIHAEIRIESRAGFGTEVIAVAKFT